MCKMDKNRVLMVAKDHIEWLDKNWRKCTGFEGENLSTKSVIEMINLALKEGAK